MAEPKDRKLAVAIARCENVAAAVIDKSHKCHVVVNYQDDTPDRHIPEGWFGNLPGARVLFVSSNPSIDPAESHESENFPRSHWTDDAIAEWVTRRIDQSWDEVPVTFQRAGHKDFLWRCVDGKYRGFGSANSPQQTWNKTHKRAIEILGPDADPSQNYALTEVVHCKSTNEHGVADAVPVCASKWLTSIVETAEQARVILICGSKALNLWARSAFDLSPEYGRRRKSTDEHLGIAKRDLFVSERLGRRTVVGYMGQPARSWTLSNIYGEKVVNLLGRIAWNEIPVPATTAELHSLIGAEFQSSD